MMFEDLLKHKKADLQKLLAYGFLKNENGFAYRTQLLAGEFDCLINIHSDGNIETHLYERFDLASSGSSHTEADIADEYVLYKTNATGEYVARVRDELESLVGGIVRDCYAPSVYRQPQTLEIIESIEKQYGDEQEFLWKKYPENGIFRHPETKKWYAAILTVARDKLTGTSKEVVEIIDLHVPADSMECLLEKEGIYPGWHMNKKHWISIILDGSIPTEEICELIEQSHQLAALSKVRKTPRKKAGSQKAAQQSADPHGE